VAVGGVIDEELRQRDHQQERAQQRVGHGGVEPARALDQGPPFAHAAKVATGASGGILPREDWRVVL